jgi:hypothetical protein
MSLAPPLLVIEGRGPLQALKGSHRLTQGHWKTLLGVFAVMISLVLGFRFASLALLRALFEAVQVYEVAGLGERVGQGVDLFVGSGVEALGSALLYTPILLAWRRIPWRVPSPR